MSGVLDFKARKNEAMMARELVKMQVEFFMQHKMVDNAELQLHLITFGSNMSTASRRAAYRARKLKKLEARLWTKFLLIMRQTL